MEIVYIAYCERERSMVPVERGGRLALYPSLEMARDAAGSLGVGAPVEWGRVLELCKRYGLGVPDPPPNGKVEQGSLEL